MDRLHYTFDSAGRPLELTSLAPSETITIERDGAVATAETTAAHDYEVGDFVFIEGADQPEYNGWFEITGKPASDEFTFTVSGSPATTATGTIDAAKVLNQVRREYNGLGQLTKDYQSHEGIVNISTTPKVQYAYSEMDGGNHSRLIKTTYPDGRILHYGYNEGVDDDISRLSFMADDDGLGDPGLHVEEYTYLGLSTVVERAHPQSGVDLTYIGGADDTVSGNFGGDKYVGLDRFGRVIDQRWVKDSTDVDRFQYGYDANGNRLYRDDKVNSGLDQIYNSSGSGNGYDALDRLTGLKEGDLDGSLEISSGTTKTWTLDALGNWTEFYDGANTTEREYDGQNRLLSQDGYGNDASFAYDENGNMLNDEVGRTFVYDAWNRLVGVDSSAYVYDALGRRIADLPDGGTQKHLYYSEQWQVLEEREGTSPDSANPTTQYVWSPVYVDAMVLRDTDAPDGKLDFGFGSAGLATMTRSGSDLGRGVVVYEATGKIYVAGEAGNNDFLLARFNSDGSLDTSFDSDGHVILDIGTSTTDGAYAIALDLGTTGTSDDRLVVVGKSGNDFAVARFNMDGSLDTGFSGDGELTIDFGSNTDVARAVAVFDSGTYAGKYVVVGTTSSNSGDFAVAMINSDGTLYSSFDSDGKQTVNFGGGSVDGAFAVAIDYADANDDIVVGGRAGATQGLARFNPGTGALDTSFDTDGLVTTDMNGSSSGEFIRALAIDGIGKIVAVGDEGFDNATVARYTSSGALDTSFDSDGKVIFNTNMDVAYAVAFHDGKIVVGGVLNADDFAVTRVLNSDGSVDQDFGQAIGGFAFAEMDSDQQAAMAIDSQGRIVMAGTAVVSADNELRLARFLNESGTLDQRLYSLHDANFNTTSVVSVRGVAVERWSYDPYGVVTSLSSSGITSHRSDWVHLHQGLEFAAISGLYAADNRWYSPVLGRWVSQDPYYLHYVDGMNLYEFVQGNPTNFTDPLGLKRKWPDYGDVWEPGYPGSPSDNDRRDCPSYCFWENVQYGMEFIALPGSSRECKKLADSFNRGAKKAFPKLFPSCEDLPRCCAVTQKLGLRGEFGPVLEYEGTQDFELDSGGNVVGAPPGQYPSAPGLKNCRFRIVFKINVPQAYGVVRLNCCS